MKVALVHDYIKEYGGAERVLEALHEIWPEAPVYTSVYLPQFLGPHRERFKDWDIRTSFLQHFLFKEKLISLFRIIAPFVFKQFNFSQYDEVIVSATGAYISNSIACHPERKRRISLQSSEDSSMVSLPQNEENKRPIHICYCHTPPRYLYGYATARNWNKSILLGSIGKMFNHFLRLVDFRSAQNVEYFIANSKNVASRIKKFYRRDSKVIYPPVDIVKDTKILGYKDIKNKKYFLTGGRLARPKNIDLIIETFGKLGLPLKVFGRAFANSLNISVYKYPNISFLGEVSDEEKLELMRSAKAYIFASEDEDFGITPVEAMGVGTAVIAYRSGGVVESVAERKTGLFFNELTVEGLKKAIQQFNRVKRDNAINPADCIRQAQKFSKEKFKREIEEFVKSKL